MTTDPRLIRWSAMDHYDAAAHALAEIPDAGPDPDYAQSASLLTISHALLGILRSLETRP